MTPGVKTGFDNGGTRGKGLFHAQLLEHGDFIQREFARANEREPPELSD
jgi:hypothetical protein